MIDIIYYGVDRLLMHFFFSQEVLMLSKLLLHMKIRSCNRMALDRLERQIGSTG